MSDEPPILDYRTPPKRFDDPTQDPARKATIQTLEGPTREPGWKIILRAVVLTILCIVVLVRVLYEIWGW